MAPKVKPEPQMVAACLGTKMGQERKGAEGRQ